MTTADRAREIVRQIEEEWWSSPTLTKAEREFAANAITAALDAEIGLNTDLQTEPLLWLDGYEHGCCDSAVAIRARRTA